MPAIPAPNESLNPELTNALEIVIPLPNSMRIPQGILEAVGQIKEPLATAIGYQKHCDHRGKGNTGVVDVAGVVDVVKFQQAAPAAERLFAGDPEQCGCGKDGKRTDFFFAPLADFGQFDFGLLLQPSGEPEPD